MRSKLFTISALVALFISLASLGAVRSETGRQRVYPQTRLPNLPQGIGLPDELQMPGRLEGTGTRFELSDSEYLNVTVDSSEPIKLRLESVPEMVIMHIESASGAVSTQITLGGFLPSTTYYKYEDDYHNVEPFTTDADGSTTYTQDLSKRHLVFIQSLLSNTKFIRDDATGGDCTSIGTWDAATKTCTLTTDLTETIQIDSDGITLDGNGHTITGSGTGDGGYFSGPTWYLERTGVTIKNLRVRSFAYGIHPLFSKGTNRPGRRPISPSRSRVQITPAAAAAKRQSTELTAAHGRPGIRSQFQAKETT